MFFKFLYTDSVSEDSKQSAIADLETKKASNLFFRCTKIVQQQLSFPQFIKKIHDLWQSLHTTFKTTSEPASKQSLCASQHIIYFPWYKKSMICNNHHTALLKHLNQSASSHEMYIISIALSPNVHSGICLHNSTTMPLGGASEELNPLSGFDSFLSQSWQNGLVDV